MTSIEDLNRTQIILLTLLVSFVVSIATGIMTFSLLSGAPTTVTQTLNRVVEHTIERVSPPNTSPQELERLKENAALIAAIDRASQASVKINSQNEEGKLVFVSYGVLVAGGTLVVSDSKNIKDEDNYIATLSDQTNLPLTRIQIENSDVAIFSISAKTGSTTPQ